MMLTCRVLHTYGSIFLEVWRTVLDWSTLHSVREYFAVNFPSRLKFIRELVLPSTPKASRISDRAHRESLSEVSNYVLEVLAIVEEDDIARTIMRDRHWIIPRHMQPIPLTRIHTSYYIACSHRSRPNGSP